MKGGKREGAGRKPGSTKDRGKLGISISRENVEWLKAMREKGHSISSLIDEAVKRLKDEFKA